MPPSSLSGAHHCLRPVRPSSTAVAREPTRQRLSAELAAKKADRAQNVRARRSSSSRLVQWTIVRSEPSPW